MAAGVGIITLSLLGLWWVARAWRSAWRQPWRAQERDRLTVAHENCQVEDAAAKIILEEIDRAIDEGAMVADRGWLES